MAMKSIALPVDVDEDVEAAIVWYGLLLAQGFMWFVACCLLLAGLLLATSKDFVEVFT